MTHSIQKSAALLAFAAIGALAAADKVETPLRTPASVDMRFHGFLETRLRANLENWELDAPNSNPAMIEMFCDRDRKADRKLLSWSGEFIGKYICASVLSYRILRDPRQKAQLQWVVGEFLKTQASDGYLGPFDKANRLTGNNWDIWGHYWVMRGLLLYHEEFQSPEALQAVNRAADLLVGMYLDKDLHMTTDNRFGQMNHAVIHAFTKLYRVTGNEHYLSMAKWIVKEWDRPGAGLYMRMALEGRPMYEFPGNRWESLHDFQGMADMYLLTAEPRYKTAFTHIWNSMLVGDRHNTGGFSSGEKATGNPYDPKTIETCSTVAWIDMSIDMLRLTGNSHVADEIELSTLNGALGGQSASGRWWTYNTPMNGVKEASAHGINFQCRAGSPELNCCSVNGPRSLGLLTEWALMVDNGGFALNFYGPSEFSTQTQGGQTLTLAQTTEYPADGNIAIKIRLQKPEKFALKLRIPSWSAKSTIAVNGVSQNEVQAGTYSNLMRTWKDGDTVNLVLDMSPHLWVGEREVDGQASIYRGPLLLAFDPAYNKMNPDAVPQLDAKTLRLEPVKTDKRIQPWVLVKGTDAAGNEIVLCDFTTAGAYGNFYRSWLPMQNASPVPATPDRPAWNNRP
ncbi:MAG: beta-L-arabinofuranosidase domain-containing protein [Acidobacteriota bacterium]